MRRWHFVAVAGAVAACRPAPVASTASATLSAEHAAAIGDSVNAMLDAFRGAFNARDVAAAASYYADDPRFRWIEEGRVRYSSKAQIADALKQLAGMRSVDISYYDPIVSAVAPGTAVLITNFAQKVTDSTGVPVGFAGVLTATIIRTDAGWRFLVGHTSSLPRPAATVQGKSAS